MCVVSVAVTLWTAQKHLRNKVSSIYLRNNLPVFKNHYPVQQRSRSHSWQINQDSILCISHFTSILFINVNKNIYYTYIHVKITLIKCNHSFVMDKNLAKFKESILWESVNYMAFAIDSIVYFITICELLAKHPCISKIYTIHIYILCTYIQTHMYRYMC